MTRQTEKASADNIAKTQDNTSSDRAFMAQALSIYAPDIGLAIHRAIEAKFILNEAPEPPVLDLGCSDGRFTSLWNSDRSEKMLVLGCDPSRDEIERSNKKNIFASTIVADGRELPFKDNSIGTVISNSVLTHVPDIDSLIAEVSRVLKPGGKFMATVPGPKFEDQLICYKILKSLGFHWLAQRSGDRYHLRWQQIHRDGKPVWHRRLKKHGLSLVEARPYPGQKTGTIWSLAFTLIRAGKGRFTLLSLLNKLRTSIFSGFLSGFFSKLLSPLLSDERGPVGSLFLSAHKMNGPDSDISSYAEPMHLSSTNLPDLNNINTWLTRSNILIENEAPVMSGGYGNYMDGLTGKSSMLYSEITGYAAQFWLRQAQPDSLRRAINAGECLLRIQEKREQIAGSFPYGMSRPDGKAIQAFFSFDAGICGSAFIDLALKTGEKRFKEGAELAGSFLNSMQNKDGSFSAVHVLTEGSDSPVMEEWFTDRCVLHGKNAIALVKLWQLTGHEQWHESACRTLDWICSIQGLRGEFPHRQGALLSMTHTHCYATEGLLYAGLVMDNDRYLTAGIRGAEWLRVAQQRSGAFHRDYKTQGNGLPKASNQSIFHVGPVAQAVRIWWVASRISPGRHWAEAAARSLGFLSKIQILDKNSIFYGAFPQSVRFFGIRPRQKNTHYSPWEAMFAYEAARLWTTGKDEPASSIF